MERPKASSVAWGVLLASVSAYELLCDDGDTLSEYLDPHMEKRWKQVLVLGAGALITTHIANVLPRPIDPFDNGLSRVRQAYKHRGGRDGTT